MLATPPVGEHGIKCEVWDQNKFCPLAFSDSKDLEPVALYRSSIEAATIRGLN